jgi:hypothetical protein
MGVHNIKSFWRISEELQKISASINFQKTSDELPKRNFQFTNVVSTF